MKKFTVATANYNCSQFLQDYFVSITRQTIEFTENINIIIVDDGSTDNSIEIIERWTKRYPDNIRLLTQKKQGQAIARNYAMQYVDTQWVTFIDADDWISRNYFEEIDDAINQNPDCDFFTAAFSTYFHDTNHYRNLHYSNNNINKENRHTSLLLNENLDSPRLSASASIINYDIIMSNKLEFRNVKPAFEDADFMLRYYRLIKKKIASYSTNASYFYRKSSIYNSSTKDIATNEKFYTSFFYEGVIPFINFIHENYGELLNYEQKILMEVTQWQLKILFNNNELFLKLLDEKQGVELLNAYSNIFALIDDEVFKEYTKFYHSELLQGIVLNYKNKLIEDFNKAIIFKSTINYTVVQIYSLENDDIVVRTKKGVYSLAEVEHYRVESVFCNETFVVKNLLYIPCHPVELVSVELNDIVIEISNKKQFMHYSNTFSPNSILLFMDRIDCADDNAEVLYEWFRLEKPEFRNKYFILDRNSSDWNRLMEKGYNLIAYGSRAFLDLYINADYILSSHCEKFIIDNNDLRTDGAKSKFVFLQHGVMIDDFLTWLSFKKLNYIVSSGKTETLALQKLFKNSVIQSGLPRFSREEIAEGENILYAPGWSSSLKKMSDEEFKESTKYSDFFSICESKVISDYLEKTDKYLFIKPHPNIAGKYSEFMPTSKRIIISKDSYAELFKQCSRVLTDYSSVFSDIYVAGGDVAFLQRNPEEFYANHNCKNTSIYQNFGPILTSIEGVEKFICGRYRYESDRYESYREKEFGEIIGANNCEKIFEYLIGDTNEK